MNFDMPNPDPDVEVGNFSRQWIRFLSTVRNVIVVRSQAGTTAQRPTKSLEIGLPYFDTSLGAHGMPIWISQVKPAVVWVDSASNIV